MTPSVKSLVKKFNEEGIPSGKVAALFNSADQQFTDRDCWNHLRHFRSKNLDVGDAQAVLCYFRRKQTENPSFFYAIQCDGEARMIFILD
ncbi:FAR1-related sequence 5 [Hibiscus trionum]|uniref:FAR1-related sequence 5 n=1 Tax=Hibiscus trionum TaxID=183268 RepID=A0A9W7HNQ7_HIBTR|nr:FAR1-related sequence 5 [Hibiscus trionum]